MTKISFQKDSHPVWTYRGGASLYGGRPPVWCPTVWSLTVRGPHLYGTPPPVQFLMVWSHWARMEITKYPFIDLFGYFYLSVLFSLSVITSQLYGASLYGTIPPPPPFRPCVNWQTPIILRNAVGNYSITQIPVTFTRLSVRKETKQTHALNRCLVSTSTCILLVTFAVRHSKENKIIKKLDTKKLILYKIKLLSYQRWEYYSFFPLCSVQN